MKQNSLIVGITGGIGTGKSTATKIIIRMGYPVIDADKISREVVAINKPAYLDIIKVFGKEILKEDETIDRIKLGKIVFNDIKLRMKLNEIVHPRVKLEIIKRINDLLKYNEIIFLDIPLLVENISLKDELNIDFIWLIYSDKETQIDRIMKRDNIDKELAIKKIEAQMPIDEKIYFSDVVLYNTTSVNDLESSIEYYIKKLIKYQGENCIEK